MDQAHRTAALHIALEAQKDAPVAPKPAIEEVDINFTTILSVLPAPNIGVEIDSGLRCRYQIEMPYEIENKKKN